MTNHPPAEAVAAEVRAEMGRQRKSQVEMARALGIHQATAARRLDGSTQFGVAELIDVAAWLGVTASQLLARAEATAGTTKQAS